MDEYFALTGQRIVDELHALTGSAKRRLWIASPYIGSWKAVRRIIGLAWEQVDVKLLTDEKSGCLARDTVERFAAHRPVRSLAGLHAKLYIVDDSALLTSANLTEYAFTRRHEVGLLLKGEQAAGLIATYEYLWKLGHDVDIDQINFSKPIKGVVDEGHAGSLPKLFTLPPFAGVRVKAAGDFADYQYFLEQYGLFAEAYISCGGRDRPEQPLYLETDKFLNFLFHHEGEPSKEYTSSSKPHRNLADVDRVSEIKKYRARYRDAGFPGGSHFDTAKLVRQYLSEPKVMQLTNEEVGMIAGKLNCFSRLRLALSKFLKGNDLDTVRRSWSDLVHGSGVPTFRMNNCHSALFGFGKSATQELLGYYDPEQFPLRNQNTNAGLRFLGYNVNAK